LLTVAGAALHAIQIARAHFVSGHCVTRTLGAPYRFTKAFHHVVHCRVLIGTPCNELSEYGSDARRLIN
jgi:hypothetical protein